MFLRDFNVVITVVTRGHSDKVMESAKKAGAEGATIISARGNSIHETDTVLGISIQPEKDVVMILVKKQIRKRVMREICSSSGLSDAGQGICFSLPVDEVGGIVHLLNNHKSSNVVKRPNIKDKNDGSNISTEDKKPDKEEKVEKSTKKD